MAVFALFTATCLDRLQAAEPQNPLVLVIHGGAGRILREEIPPELERQYRDALEQALRAGYAVLQREGGRSMDAVEAAIRTLEDGPLFDAGRGSVFNREGRAELDASVMDGKNRRAGAVAAVGRIRNPIVAARAVMEKSEHVLLVGEGAELFARSQGLPEVAPMYFWTERRWKAFMKAREEELKNQGKSHEPAPGKTGSAVRAKTAEAALAREPYGTVGAVALDRFGDLAAGTSTGGTSYKRPGRVGDSPILGAGTYADNETCAVSCTGHGEIFMRYVVAHDIASRIRYRGASVAEAAEEALKALPKEPNGVGGVIVLDRKGHFAIQYNTPGMYRGYMTGDGQCHVAIWDR